MSPGFVDTSLSSSSQSAFPVIILSTDTANEWQNVLIAGSVDIQPGDKFTRRPRHSSRRKLIER